MADVIIGKVGSYEGLNTYIFTAPADGQYIAEGKISLPTISEGESQSGVIVTINVNGGSDIYTGEQAAEGFRAGSFLSEGDTLEITLSSSETVDQSLNVIKSTISIFEQ